MRLIKPKYEIVPQEPGLEGIYKNIELAGRNCYKSEPVEGVTSKDFVERLMKRKHLSVLEHGTIYLIDNKNPYHLYERYKNNPYSKTVLRTLDYSNPGYPIKECYVTTNYRVLVENDWLDDLQYLCEPTEFHDRRVTVKFTSNIHFYKDLTRHRRMSFAIESTNYCNYCKDRFGEEITYIIPVWLDLPEGGVYWHDGIGWRVGATEENDYLGESVKPNDKWDIETCKAIHYFLSDLDKTEKTYSVLINYSGWKARQAAEVLPQATKADVIMTGFVSDWKHIFDLRTSVIAKTGQPHPEVSRLFDPLYNEFKELKLI